MTAALYFSARWLWAGPSLRWDCPLASTQEQQCGQVQALGTEPRMPRSRVGSGRHLCVQPCLGPPGRLHAPWESGSRAWAESPPWCDRQAESTVKTLTYRPASRGSPEPRHPHASCSRCLLTAPTVPPLWPNPRLSAPPIKTPRASWGPAFQTQQGLAISHTCSQAPAPSPEPRQLPPACLPPPCSTQAPPAQQPDSESDQRAQCSPVTMAIPEGQLDCDLPDLYPSPHPRPPEYCCGSGWAG